MICATCKENDFSVHEDNVVINAACLLQTAGYNITVKEYMGKVDGSAAYCDMVVRLPNDDDIFCIVEFKNRHHYYTGECDCATPVTPQIEKYCTFGYPIYICNGYEEVPSLLDWITNLKQLYYNDTTNSPNIARSQKRRDALPTSYY